jgi:hypothetical protein
MGNLCKWLLVLGSFAVPVHNLLAQDASRGSVKQLPVPTKQPTLPPVPDPVPQKTPVLQKSPVHETLIPDCATVDWCTTGNCCQPTGPCDSCCQTPSWSFHFDFLYLTARGADVPFAQAFDGVGPLAVPRGTAEVADPDYSPGFRVGGSYRFTNCSWLEATFTWFDSDTAASLRAPAGTAIRSYLTFPNTVSAAVTPLAASARYDIGFRFGDVDYRRSLCCNQCYQVNWLVGVRFAHRTRICLPRSRSWA